MQTGVCNILFSYYLWCSSHKLQQSCHVLLTKRFNHLPKPLHNTWCSCVSSILGVHLQIIHWKDNKKLKPQKITQSTRYHDYFAWENSQSISGSPLMSSSSSLSLKIEISSRGTSSLKPSRNELIWGRIALVKIWSATRSTYSCLVSSVTLIFLPPGLSSKSVTCKMERRSWRLQK